MSGVNEFLEVAREKKERFSKFLKQIYPNDLFGGDELLNVWHEWKTMDDKIQSLELQLEKAEKVIDFYADPESWIYRDDKSWMNVTRDQEKILKYKHPATDWVGTINVNGKRAREYKSEKMEGVK